MDPNGIGSQAQPEGTPAARPSKLEAVKVASQYLKVHVASELGNAESHFTDDAANVLKFHGSYQQDDRDLRTLLKKEGKEKAYSFMVRIRMPGGKLATARQYLACAELARTVGNGTLRITTRQELQIHRVHKTDLPASIRRVTMAYRGREEAVARDAAGNWVAESPPDSRVLPEAVVGILQSLAPLRAVRVETLSATNLAAYGLDESATRLTFSLSDDAGLQKTLIVSTNGAAGGVYGAVQGQDAVFVIPRDTAARLTRSMVVWQ